jgi:YesN/AraC family two-component response regulator
MLFRVYLVDDEALVLDKLKNSVPWLENGFEVIGSSTDPATAIEEILVMEPDVVFSDLKMPEYDGIELIKKLKENGISADFVLLTAFQDFEACREFLRLDGLDYCLKPLNEENAAITLEQISRKLGNKRNQKPTTVFAPSQSKSFDALVSYVSERYNQKLSLNELSQSFSMSQSSICNMFAKHYESTFIMFITNLRMKEAHRLMLETGTTLKEIASHCGYPSYHRFCKVFKTHYGKPPSEYREENG